MINQEIDIKKRKDLYTKFILIFILSFKLNSLIANNIEPSLISYNIGSRYRTGELKTCFKKFKEEKLFKLKFKDSNLFRMLTLNNQKIIITIKGKDRPYLKLKGQSAMPIEIVLPDIGKAWCNAKAQENTIYYLKQNLLEKLTERMLTFMDEASDATKITSPTLICSDDALSDLIQKHFQDIKYHEIQDYIILTNGKHLQLSSLPNSIESTLRSYFWDLRNAQKVDHLIKEGKFKEDEGIIQIGQESSGLTVRDTLGVVHTMPTIAQPSIQNCNFRYRRTKQGLKERVLFNCQISSLRLRKLKPYECKSCTTIGMQIIQNEQEIEDKFIEKAKSSKVLSVFKTTLESIQKDQISLKMSDVGKEKFLSTTSDLYIKLWILEDIASRLGVSKPQAFYTLKMDLDKARKGLITEINISDFREFNELIFH